MMNEIISEANLPYFAVTGLILFVAVFVTTSLWALSRSRKEINNWSSLPLADGYDPVEPRKK